MLACFAVLMTGITSLAGPGVMPVQTTLGLLLITSFSFAFVILGMMTALVRSLER